MRSDWSAYYSGRFISPKQLVFEDGNRYYLWENNFINLTQTVVDVSSHKSTTKFLFECCFFNNLSFAGIPGINFISEGECVLSRICVYESYSLSSFQFMHSNVTNGEFKNYVLESSFYKCGNLGYGICTIKSFAGNIKHMNNNLTNNFGDQYATIQLFNNNKDDGMTNSYSTYYNCSSNTHLICCYLNDFSLYKCNYLSNTGELLFRSNPGQVAVSSSFIFDNSIKIYSSSENGGSIRIINSTLLNNGNAQVGMAIIRNSLNFSQYLFFFLKTKLCYAEEPFYLPIGQPVICVNTCICHTSIQYFLVICFILM